MFAFIKAFCAASFADGSADHCSREIEYSQFVSTFGYRLDASIDLGVCLCIHAQAMKFRYCITELGAMGIDDVHGNRSVRLRRKKRKSGLVILN